MSIRHFKKLFCVFELRLKQLLIDLAGVFRVGKPITPEERLAEADRLIRLARPILNLLPILHELEGLLERVEGQRELFARANNSRKGPKNELVGV